MPTSYPSFNHIHCSSRFDRSIASLESDLDNWMDQASVITLTEIATGGRASAMREKGWDSYNARSTPAAAECGIAWRRENWKAQWQGVRKLHTQHWIWKERRTLSRIYLHAPAVVIRNTESGHRLLVTVAHMVNGIDGSNPGFSTVGYGWESRKNVFIDCNKTWSRWVHSLIRQKRPDAVLVCADWNVSLKETWFRQFLKTHWGQEFKQAWVRFPTEGASLHGGPVAPLGAPGVSNHDRIIDGTLYTGLKVSREPNLMATVRSSDHRPYKEGFRFRSPAEQADDDTAHGDIHHGDAWWGFGDYMTDEIYVLPTARGEAGGEVL
jgi:hypothetical protein